MEFRSFEQLNRIADDPTARGVVRLILSAAAAIVILSGLVMLFPLGT